MFKSRDKQGRSTVEAEILGCCANKSCGWDGKAQTCRYWPFLNQEEQDGWNERCCTEDTILRKSSREVICNSVKPEAERKKLEERDPHKLPSSSPRTFRSPRSCKQRSCKTKTTSGVGDCSDLHEGCSKQDKILHMKQFGVLDVNAHATEYLLGVRTGAGTRSISTSFRAHNFRGDTTAYPMLGAAPEPPGNQGPSAPPAPRRVPPCELG